MLSMDEDMELKFPIKFEDFNRIESNFTGFLFEVPSPTTPEVVTPSDPEYEQFLADVWVGIVLTLMVLSCVCFMCSCLIYHKIQQWKTRMLASRNASNIESNLPESELPSYTIASGLPTYEEALEQLKTVKQTAKTTSDWQPKTPPTPMGTLSVANLFQNVSKNEGSSVSIKS